MDNLCHTLVGAAFGEAGLKRQTRYGDVTLLATANLPDIDILGFVTREPSVAYHRGWTHGVLALAILPVAFTGAVLWWHRVRGRPRPNLPPVRAGWLLALSLLGVASHIFLDLQTVYGVRLLEPFSHRWFYGDSLFIVDVWLWLILGVGVLAARRLNQSRYARHAVALAVIYVIAMIVSSRAARQIVLERWTTQRGAPPEELMVAPEPVTPFIRTVIVDTGDHFETGTFRWRGRRFQLLTVYPRRDSNPFVSRAQQDSRIRAILTWARFPYFDLSRVSGGTRVTLTDLRFGRRVGSATVLVPD
jgi:inner membrane protein